MEVMSPAKFMEVAIPDGRDLDKWHFYGPVLEAIGTFLRDRNNTGFIKDVEGGLDLRREAIFSPTCTICGLTSGYQGEGSAAPHRQRLPCPRLFLG